MRKRIDAAGRAAQDQCVSRARWVEIRAMLGIAIYLMSQIWNLDEVLSRIAERLSA